jgi:hypothetical protein
MERTHQAEQYPRPLWELVFGLLILAFAIWLFLLASVDAHDSWISRGALRNGAGEWCCGEGDCFVIPSQHVAARADGYHLFGDTEVVPFAEAQVSPDGAYWRCKRPDGTRRCFFAPPPNS